MTLEMNTVNYKKGNLMNKSLWQFIKDFCDLTERMTGRKLVFSQSFSNLWNDHNLTA